MKSISIAFAFVLTVVCGSFGAEGDSLGPEGHVFTNQRLFSGMPLGGIGTGKIELFTDGSFGNFTINNNYHQPVENPQGCFTAIAVSGDSGIVAKKLVLKNTDPRGVENVVFKGVFSIAEVDFTDSALPVKVQMQAFSPFFLSNENDSCVPSAVFVYTVRNESKKALDVSLAMSWKNLIGIGGVPGRIFDASGECSQRALERGRLSGIHFQYKSDMKDGQERNAMGDYSLFYVQEKKEKTSVLTEWNNEAPESFWDSFGENGAFPQSKSEEKRPPIADGSRPCSAVAAMQTIKPGEERQFVFIFSWCMPHLIDEQGTDHGVYYVNRWKDSLAVSDWIGKRWEELRRQIEEERRPILESSLPEWMSERLMNTLASIPSSSVRLKDGRFFTLTGDARYPGNLTSPEEYLASIGFWLRWYPDWLKEQIHQFADCQLATGEVPNTVGNLYTTIGTGDIPGGFPGRPDSTGAFILLTYKYYLTSGDEEFLKALYPHINAALNWLIGEDKNGDSIPDGPSFWQDEIREGASVYSASLWAAALEAGEEWSSWFNNYDLQTQCHRTRERALNNTASQLWNGRFFNRYFDSNRPSAPDSGVLLPEAFPGEWFAAGEGWRPLFDRSQVHQSLVSLLGMFSHGSPDVYRTITFPPFFESFGVSTLVLYGYTNAAWECERRLDARGADLFESPWKNALQTGDGARASAAALSSWTFLDSAAGAQLDMRRRCIIVGFLPPSELDRFSFPFKTQLYSGMIEWTRSRLTGQVEYNIHFDQAPSSKKTTLLQAACLLPNTVDSNHTLLRVMHNGSYVPGTDFSRVNQRTYGFNNPLSLRRGDTLTLVLAQKNCGKILVDTDRNEITNLGAKCSIEQAAKTVPGFSFTAVNLLRSHQMIHLELNGSRREEDLIYLNGERLAVAADGLESFPILLQTSPLKHEEYEWLRFLRNACADTARRLVDNPDRTRLLDRLWTLQGAVDRALEVDTLLRGIRVTICPAEDHAARESTLPTVEPEAAVSAFERVKKEMREWREILDSGDGDPVLLSELAGYFAPLQLRVVTGDTGAGIDPFSVTAQVMNPFLVSADFRLRLNAPAGWRAVSSDRVSFESTEKPKDEYRLRYTVTPTQSLWENRYELAVVLTGTWEGLPFRREQIFSVGHSFLKQWLIVGPFVNREGEGFDRIYPPEMDIDTKAEYEGKTRSLTWTPYQSPTGYIDFNTLLSPNDNAVAFAYLGIYSPKERPARIEFGADEGIIIYHNYKKLYAKQRMGSAIPSAAQAVTNLNQGWNHFLIKVTESTGAWGFYFEITDLYGRVIPDLQYSLEKAL